MAFVRRFKTLLRFVYFYVLKVPKHLFTRRKILVLIRFLVEYLFTVDASNSSISTRLRR